MFQCWRGRQHSRQFVHREIVCGSSCWRPRQQPCGSVIFVIDLSKFCLKQKALLILKMSETYHPEFLTATILNWQNLLASDAMKEIVVNSMKWLVENEKCKINAFVIMPNHIHLIWKIADCFERQEVQGALFSFTSHAFKKILLKNEDKRLNDYYVEDIDRDFQFWERNPMVKECFHEKFYLQKLDYIHHNPCQPKWLLCDKPESYQWSSASFYENNDTHYSWLTHYND
jgi:putative transposase